jgi:hypothetical protein
MASPKMTGSAEGEIKGGQRCELGLHGVDDGGDGLGRSHVGVTETLNRQM